MSADSVFDVGTADMVEITIGYIDERGMSRKYDGLAGDFVLGIAEVNINTVGTSERKLGIDMLACARVLGLLNNDHLIFIHLLSNTECRRECSVAGRTLFKALKGSKRFGDKEYASIQELTDNTLTVTANTINLSGSVKLNDQPLEFGVWHPTLTNSAVKSYTENSGWYQR